MDLGFVEILQNTIPFFCIITGDFFLLIQAEEFDLLAVYKPADLV
jgi:hypothetical protein